MPLLTGRLIRNQIREPAASLVNLVISIFFLLVYLGGLGGGLGNNVLAGNYTTFLLPTAIMFAVAAGSTSGQVLVDDIESTYFYRLLTMPLARSALVLAPKN